MKGRREEEAEPERDSGAKRRATEPGRSQKVPREIPARTSEVGEDTDREVNAEGARQRKTPGREAPSEPRTKGTRTRQSGECSEAMITTPRADAVGR